LSPIFERQSAVLRASRTQTFFLWKVFICWLLTWNSMPWL